VSEERIPIRVDNGAGTDTIAPQVAIMTPTRNEEMRGSVDIKVLATDNSGDAPYVSVFVDKQLRGVSNTQPYSYAVNTAEYDNGEHVIEAWAYDAARNKGTAQAVTVRFNNPGGATTLNEDVNRMGRAAAPAPPPTTAPALPIVAGEPPAHPTKVAALPPSEIPVVHIPPVRDLAPRGEQPVAPPMALPEVEDAEVHRLTPESAGIRELPVTPAPSGIQEMAVEPEPSGITELPVVPATPARETPARPVRVAKRPTEERKPDMDAAAASALHAAASAAQAARRVEAPVPVPEPIVLRMEGDRVMPNPPAPKKVLIAKADTAPRAAPAVEDSNPAPRPHTLAALPQPTAKAVHVAKALTHAAPVPKPSAQAHRPARVAALPSAEVRRPAPAPRPTLIPELPADAVRNGRIHHAVRPGESVKTIAHAYGVSVKRLMAANGLGRRAAPRIGQVLQVPTAVRIALNDAPVQFDVAPRIQDGMTLAAIRQIYEQAGGRVTWDALRREVRATGGAANIIVRIGSNEAFVNGRKVQMDAVAFIEDGRTMLPVRFMTDALDLQAEYDLRSGAINLHVDAAEPRKV
jgi:hypothetical protein